MNLRCRMFGHKYDEEAAEYYCVYHCVRCDHSQGEPGMLPRIWLRISIWRYKAKQWLVWKLEWFLPCKYCGHMFGKHDDTKDHLPF